MEKNNKIILTLIIIVSVLVLGGCVYSIMKNDISETDAVKFRNEYMELNDQINEVNGKSYVNVTLSDTNTFKYITEKNYLKERFKVRP